MTDMIEQVARAIYFRGEDQGDAAWKHAQPGRRTVAIEQAKAALEAMRGCTMLLRQDGAMIHEVRGAPDDLWKAFLDGALTEQPVPADPGIPIYATRDATDDVLGKPDGS